MKYLVTYDIMCDKRREKLAACLEDYGDRVQLSVFEVDVDPERFQRMLSKVKDLIDPAKDSVRIYSLCATCAGKVRILGVGVIIGDADVIVV